MSIWNWSMYFLQTFSLMLHCDVTADCLLICTTCNCTHTHVYMCTYPLVYTGIALRTHGMYICFIRLCMYVYIDKYIHICAYIFHAVYSAYIFHKHVNMDSLSCVHWNLTSQICCKYRSATYHTIVRVWICIFTYTWFKRTISVELIAKCRLFCSMISAHFYT